MARHVLSSKRVLNAKPRKGGKRGMYCDGGGLWLQVSVGKTGKLHRSWLFVYSTGTTISKKGKPRQDKRAMGLGSLEDVSLHEARAAAEKCRKLRREGIDPLQERNNRKAAVRIEAAKAMTFDACRDAYIDAHHGSWSNAKHAAEWGRSLETYVTPVFGKLPVQQIDTALVMKALQPLWAKARVSGSRVRGRIEAILDWAKVSGYREGENPARWKGHLDNLLAAKARGKAHHEAMSYVELPAFVQKLHARTAVCHRALQVVILTALRASEVTEAKWEEFDLAAKKWVVPANRMKMRVDHTVPLSDAVLRVIEQMKAIRCGDYVFPGGRVDKPINQKMMLRAVNQMGYTCTVHGFRATFKTWATETTAYPREVIEVALAHAVGDETERSYLRGDMLLKRRKLMDSWARYCGQPRAKGVVIPIRAGANA
jgi:integrase